ncbi:glutathione peroxidase [Chitinophaga polysaccharea]|uniref:glutathione peroxidase n=1 Tax=Chitinophaga TaxID=79328 RepID=UPI001455C479|nr:MULTISPECIES: glutathione peroxidase [Chitinophaga]NLR59969.1 glutathione peroxidase [Chitinophaga polysaccharea]NLU94198.1 glutathione peroxidase [Chitinophaga sp. Ak27]
MFRLAILSIMMFFASSHLYDFKVDAVDGGKIDFSKYKGKKVLIVNTASLCGNTPQYEGLEKLYKKYQNKLVIVGFPANNFGSQEPGSNKEIQEFCTKKYAVTFPMAAKISVKGTDIHPLYKWLLEESKAKHFEPAEVTWNFQKYLLDEKGNLVAVFSPKTQPESAEVIAAIEK